MQQPKEPQTAVCWRIKGPTLEWIKAQAREQERPINWIANKILEQARAQHQQGAKA